MLEASRVGSVDTGRTGKRFGGNRDTTSTGRDRKCLGCSFRDSDSGTRNRD